MMKSRFRSGTTEKLRSPVQHGRFLKFVWKLFINLLRHAFFYIIAGGPIPRHVAIIMDGNRRYADRVHVSRPIGHLFGYDRLIDTLEMFHELGVKVLSVYAFSIDNFQRPAAEVASLMELLKEKLDSLAGDTDIIARYEVQVRVLGDLSLLPPPVRTSAERIMEVTRGNSKSILNVCCPYTARNEITRAIQRLRDEALASNAGIDNDWHTNSWTASFSSEERHDHSSTSMTYAEAQEKTMSSAALGVNGGTGCTESTESTNSTESTKGTKSTEYDEVEGISRLEIEQRLLTRDCGPVDLLIRTSGESRLSNFLLWQCSHAHLAFCEVLWPEFGFRHLVWAILEYQTSIWANLRESGQKPHS